MRGHQTDPVPAGNRHDKSVNNAVPRAQILTDRVSEGLDSGHANASPRSPPDPPCVMALSATTNKILN